MGRMVNTDHLCTLGEAAAKLDVTPYAMMRWRDRRYKNGFPYPIYKKKTIEIYDFLQVWAWHRDWLMQERVRGPQRGSKFRGALTGGQGHGSIENDDAQPTTKEARP